MEETNKSKKTKKSIWRAIGNWIATFGYFVVAVLELVDGRFISATGWILAGVGWWAFSDAQRDLDALLKLFKERLNECEEMDETCNEAASDVNMMSVDDILKIGRDWQKSDTWRGATHDTAKLLCDAIEMLQNKLNKRGNRNCDVYNTFESAKAACFKDRGYCSSPIAERESAIRFMLQDVKDNAENKIEPEKKDK